MSASPSSCPSPSSCAATSSSLSPTSNGWFRQQPYFAAFSNPSLLQSIMHHRAEPNNIRQSFNTRILRLAGSQDPFRLFLDLERIKKQWFYAQDTRQISKRKKFAQYVLDTRGLETLYPKLQGKADLIRMIINVYRQIQQEAFGIVLINRENKVFLVQNEKYYWSFPKGKLKLDDATYTFESQWSCALREFKEEVNVDLSGWSPSQYWEARLADNRMVGLFVIENFDESTVDFDFDKREIIDIMWFNLCTTHDEMHTLRQYWKEQQRLSDPYYTALPFIEHLIFEYLPRKAAQLPAPASPQPSTARPDGERTPSHSSVFDMLLSGRVPLCPSSPPPLSPSSSSLSSDDPHPGPVATAEASSLTVLNIIDRLNAAIRQARCNDESQRASPGIVVQAL